MFLCAMTMIMSMSLAVICSAQRAIVCEDLYCCEIDNINLKCISKK